MKSQVLTHSNNEDHFDEKSVHKGSCTIEDWPDDIEYMVPSRENTKFWQSTSESDKSELNMTQMILTQFLSEITYDEDLDECRYIPTRDYVRLWDDRIVIYHEVTRKSYQYHNATNSIMTVDVEHCTMGN